VIADIYFGVNKLLFGDNLKWLRDDGSGDFRSRLELRRNSWFVVLIFWWPWVSFGSLGGIEHL
jgi:hypothetical protein